MDSELDVKETGPRALDAALTHLLIRVEAGWSPTPRRYDAPLELSWGGVPLPPSSSQIAEDDDELVVVVRGAPASLTDVREALGKDGTLTASYADEFSLEAPRAFIFSQSMSWGESGESTVKIRATRWCVRDTNVEPSFWLMELDDAALDGPGNLIIGWRASGPTGGASTSLGHFALKGLHEYFLVEQKRRARTAQWIVMPAEGIDSADPAADLYTDFVALQYLAGRRVCVRRMFGVSDDLQVVAEAGVHLGQRRVARTEITPPVPLRSARRPFVVPFFAALSKELATEPGDVKPLRVALVWCTEATSDTYLDGRLLRLGAAARAILRGADTTSELKSTEALCEARYANLKLPLADASREALRATDALMATGLLPEYGSEYIDKHLRHIAEMRGIIAVLAARHCGYTGPLGGDARYDAKSGDDDDHADDALPIERVRAHADLPARPTSVEWGDFGLIEPSEVKALRPAIEMADLLERHTDGRVAGRLRWSARSDEETTWFDLEAYLTRDPRTHMPLASVGYREDGNVVIVRGPGGDETSHRDTESLIQRLGAFGRSDEVRKSVNSLLGLDQALGAR